MAAPLKQRLTPQRARRFVEALAACGNVTEAARVAGVSRVTVYGHRNTDPIFAAAWANALEEAADTLEMEARRRAVEGVEEPVVSMGKVVRNDDGSPMTVRKYSDQLLQFLLKGARPDKYRENVKISGQVQASIIPSPAARPIGDVLVEAVEEYPEARAALAARLLALADGNDGQSEDE